MPTWVDGLAAEAGAEIIRAAATLAGGATVAAWVVSWEVLFSAAGTLVVGIPVAVADIPADEGVIRAAIRVAREPVEMNTNAVIGILTTWPVSAARGFTTLIRRISVI